MDLSNLKPAKAQLKKENESEEDRVPGKVVLQQGDIKELNQGQDIAENPDLKEVRCHYTEGFLNSDLKI